MATVETLSALVEQALADVAQSRDLAALDEVRVRLLGKKGLLTEQLKSLGKLPAGERPAAGQKINDAKAAIHAALEAHRERLEQQSLSADLARGTIDVTLPGRGQEAGSVHPVTRTRLRIERIFMQAGFKSRRDRKSRTISTTSRRSIFRRIIRRAPCTTHSIFRTAGCCVRTPRPCRFAPCARAARRCR